jgi:hypothetical protein
MGQFFDDIVGLASNRNEELIVGTRAITAAGIISRQSALVATIGKGGRWCGPDDPNNLFGGCLVVETLNSGDRLCYRDVPYAAPKTKLREQVCIELYWPVRRSSS